MPFFRALFEFLNAGEVVPKPYGIFHLVWLFLTAVAIVTLAILWRKEIIKDDKRLLIVASVILAIFELYKQINVIFGDGTSIGYDFNQFPYRYNTLLIYLGIIGGMTKNKVHYSVTAFIGTYLLFIGAYGLFFPQFSAVIGRNVQTMVSYGAMVVVGTFLWFLGKVKPEFKTFLKALPTFLMIYALSITFNIIIHGLNFNIDAGNLLGSCVICDLKASIWRFVLLSVIAFLVVLLALAIKKLVTTDFDAEYGKTDEIAKSIRKSAGYNSEESDGVFKFNKKDYSKNGSYMETYFKNLHTNFGNNAKGSCAYVAAAMLLSYYDTVLRDSIVPENYDFITESDDEPNFTNSPGTGFLPRVRSQYNPRIVYDPAKMTYNEYVQFINAAKNKYLHEKLIVLAMELGLIVHDPRDYSGDKSFGSGHETIEKVLNVYLQGISDIKNFDYDVYGKNFTEEYFKPDNIDDIKEYSKEIRKYAIKYVKKGLPVLLGMFDGYDAKEGKPSNGHMVVAYAYNELKDELYCHMGWEGDGNTFVVPENIGYKYFTSALVLEFDDDRVRHIHSNNYLVYINGGEFFYCPEGENGLEGTYTTRSDFIVEFDKSRENCAIIGINRNDYIKFSIPEYYGNVRVAKIHQEAFANQKYLAEVELPCSIDTIEESTFKNDRELKKIIIPASVTCIKRNAFKNCDALESIQYLGTKAQWAQMTRVGGWDRNTGDYLIYCRGEARPLNKHNETKDYETLV